MVCRVRRSLVPTTVAAPAVAVAPASAIAVAPAIAVAAPAIAVAAPAVAVAAPAVAVAAKAGRVKIGTTSAVNGPLTPTSAGKGGRTQRRAGCGDRRGGQSNRYLVHHDAPPFVRRCAPAVTNETQQFPFSFGVPQCRAVSRLRNSRRQDPR